MHLDARLNKISCNKLHATAPAIPVGDRLGHFDENSSCWVRVLQDFAGAHYGSQMIPRIGDEVFGEIPQ